MPPQIAIRVDYDGPGGPPLSDDFSALFERARDGDNRAVEELLLRHLDELRAFVRLRTGAFVRAQESCSDLVQSACREALDDLGELECRDERAFRNWLFTVALHKVQNRAAYYGAQKRDRGREQTPAPRDSTSNELGVLSAYRTFCTPSHTAEVREEVERVERAFDRLAPDQREVILQARLQGRSHREIAESLGKSEVAVRKALSRALARLGLLVRGDGD